MKLNKMVLLIEFIKTPMKHGTLLLMICLIKVGGFVTMASMKTVITNINYAHHTNTNTGDGCCNHYT